MRDVVLDVPAENVPNQRERLGPIEQFEKNIILDNSPEFRQQGIGCQATRRPFLGINAIAGLQQPAQHVVVERILDD